MIARNVAEVLARCASTLSWEAGMCGQFCAAMYGYGFSGYRSALAQWEAIPTTERHPGDTNAPPGTLLFWGDGNGHVAVSDGFGSCWSTDISGPGTVSLVQTGTITSRWGKPYLGWTAPYFQGARWEPVAIHGADVSMYQPINFRLTLPATTSGGPEYPVDFAIIKVTEGISWLSSRWTGQRQWARDHGLSTGFYHFARPGNMTAQADYFLGQIDQVGLQPGDHLWFDWEDAGVSNAQKDAWIKYVQGQAPGHRVGLYCNTYFWKNRDTTSFAGDGLWIATGGIPAGQPPITAPWLIHQYSTAGDYDHDLAQFATRDDMITWAGGEMALSTEDKAWINAAIKTQVTAAIKAEAYGAVVNKDAVKSPDGAPADPTWPLAKYTRESYLRLLEIKAQAASNGSGITGLGAALNSAKSELDEVKAVLDAVDLSQLPAQIAAKVAALRLKIEEIQV